MWSVSKETADLGKNRKRLASALPLVGHIHVLALAENHRALGASLLGSE